MLPSFTNKFSDKFLLPVLSQRLLALSMLLLLVPALSEAKETLRILAWPGYADADVVTAFEKQTGAKVEVTFIDTDDALWSKFSRNKGGEYDVFAVNTAELQRYIDAGLSAPLDLAEIPNQATQLPRFRNPALIPGLQRNNQMYAVPYAYAEMGLIYNRKIVKVAPTSMTALWDVTYRGKVLAYNGSTHNFSLSALSIGSRNPFQLSSTEFRQASQQLVKLRRNVLGFYSSPEEAVKMYKESNVALVLANYGTQQLEALRAAGADVGYVVPKEGALAWLDCWVISRQAQAPKLAAQWINYTLQPEISALLSKRHGLANTVTPTAFNRNQDKLIWLEPVEDSEKRHVLWARILAGDSMQKF